MLKQKQIAVKTFWTQSKVKEWLKSKIVLEDQIKETQTYCRDISTDCDNLKQKHDEIMWIHNKSHCFNCIKKMLVQQFFEYLCKIQRISLPEIVSKISSFTSKLMNINAYLTYRWIAHSHVNDRYSISYFRAKNTSCKIKLKQIKKNFDAIQNYFQLFGEHASHVYYLQEGFYTKPAVAETSLEEVSAYQIKTMDDYNNFFEEFAVHFLIQNINIAMQENSSLQLALMFARKNTVCFQSFISNCVSNTYYKDLEIEINLYLKYGLLLGNQKVIFYFNKEITFENLSKAVAIAPLQMTNDGALFFGYCFEMQGAIFGIHRDFAKKFEFLCQEIFFKEIVHLVLSFENFGVVLQKK
jgi:hypothetical protein